MVARASGVLNRQIGFQSIGLPYPVFTVENSADNNLMHTTHSKSAHRICIGPAKHSPTATTAHIYCACAPFPEGFSAPRSVVPYFNGPVLSHVHRSFASMGVYGLLEIHSCQEC